MKLRDKSTLNRSTYFEKFGSMEAPVLRLALKTTEKHRPIADICWSSDESLIIVGHGKSLHIWQKKGKGFNLLKLDGHTKPITAVAYSSACSVALSVSEDRTVRCWLPSILGKGTFFRIHNARINSICMSTNGREFLTAADDKIVKLSQVSRKSDTVSVTFMKSFVGHTNWVRCARFSTDEKLVYTVGDEGLFRIWSKDTGKQLSSFGSRSIPAGQRCTSFEISPNGIHMAAVVGPSAQIYDLRTCLVIGTLTPPESAVTKLAWHHSGTELGCTCSDGAVRMYTVPDMETDFKIDCSDSELSSICYGKRSMLTGDKAGQLLVWGVKYMPPAQPEPIPAPTPAPPTRLPPVEIKDGVVRVAVRNQTTLPQQLGRSMAVLEGELAVLVSTMRVLENRVTVLEDGLV